MTPSQQHTLRKQEVTIDSMLTVLKDVRVINREETPYNIPINFIQQALANAQADLLDMKEEFGVKL